MTSAYQCLEELTPHSVPLCECVSLCVCVCIGPEVHLSSLCSSGGEFN